MEKRRDGRLIACEPGLSFRAVLLSDLIIPMALAVAAGPSSLWFTESWAHRVSRIAAAGNGLAAPEVVLRNLPGYPARLHRDGARRLLSRHCSRGAPI